MMNTIVVRKDTCLIIGHCNAGDLDLEADRPRIGSCYVNPHEVNLTACSVFESVDLPAGFIDGDWTYIGGVLAETGLAASGRLVAVKAEVNAAIDAELEAHYAMGFDYDFGSATASFEDGTTGPAHIQNIQTRDATDRTNWLILESVCNDMRAAGAGSAMMPMAIRTASNAEVSITADATKVFCNALKSNGAGKLGYSWGLKNAVRQAADEAAVRAIDIKNGWPA